MMTAKEQFKTDLRKDPEDLEHEADSARAELEGTLDELMQQLSPGELLNQGIALFKGSGDRPFVRNLTSQVENNPVPVILAGVSLAWLMSASKQPPVHQGGGQAHRMGEKVGAARDTGHRMAEGAGDMAHRVSDASRHTLDNARSGIRSARDGYSQMLHEQPLLVGVFAVAAGAALGSLLPRTAVEDQAVGPLSDKGTDAVKDKTEDKLQETQGSASTAPGASVSREGLQAGDGAKQPDLQPSRLDPGSGRP